MIEVHGSLLRYFAGCDDWLGEEEFGTMFDNFLELLRKDIDPNKVYKIVESAD